MGDTSAVRPAAPAARTDVVAIAAGLFTVTLWGSAFVGIRAAGASFSPGSLALGRLIVSTALLTAVWFTRRERLPQRRDLLAIASYGVLWLAVYSVALNAAERTVDAGTSALLVSTGPLLIALLAGFFLREGFPPRLYAGLAIAFAGSAIIGLAAARTAPRAEVGVALLVLAVLAYSVSVVIQKYVLRRVSSFQVTWLGVLAATIACLPFAPGLVAEVATAGPAIGWLFYLGIFPTAIGFATWTFALRRSSAGRLGSLTYVAPVVAVLLGWLLLGEAPPWAALLGGALCLAGVYVASRRPSS